jgi:DNA-binding winged helix-turn-helix (wHTH) protein/TolB-like protein
VRFHFGLFEFDAATFELRREGVLVRLQLQPTQVLACLIERAGQVVSRDDLRKTVWGSETFVDFDGGLNFCITQIRSALKDDSAEPLYIRTVPKSGYQFIAPVQRVADEPAQSPATMQSAHKQRIATSRPMLAYAIIALAVLAGAFASYHFGLFRRTPSQPILAVVRFDNETGDPAITRFSDALTDNVVERLTSQSSGRYRVVGNAQILRLPREQRDLTAIAASVGAAYVVLGQVQTSGDHVRILAHLIRLSDQAHIWVARMDGDLADPLTLESDAAGKIAAQFSPRILADPSRAVPLASATR